MSKPHYESHLKLVKSHTTAKGGSYIKTFDLVRSENGRAVVDRHAQIPITVEKSPAGGSDNSGTPQIEKVA